MQQPRASILALVATLATMVAAGSPALATSFETWPQVADPAAAGWSVEKLEAARERAGALGSSAVLVVHAGRVVVAWGQVSRPFPLYSMRKGLYDALVGIAVSQDRLDTDTSLAELGIDDLGGLTETERSATVHDLLAARSGIYHPSAYEPASMKRSRPERGSHERGTRWFYNNWDFNVAAHLVERSLGGDLFEAFEERIARPLGMEDFSRDDGFSFLEPSHSRHPAPLFRMSARDLARFGLLYLRRGDWFGRRILEPGWIEASWTMHSVFEEGNPFGAGRGFGYLWWIHPGRPDGATPFASHDVYLTRGSDGQILAVIPALDVVAVHQADAEHGHEVGFEDALDLLDRILLARGAGKTTRVETTPLDPAPLPNPSPAPEERSAIPWTERNVGSMVGAWVGARGVRMEVHAVEGRLFANPLNVPLAEVELFAETPDRIFSPAVDVLLDVERDETGRAIRLTGRVDGIPMEIVRAGETASGPGGPTG